MGFLRRLFGGGEPPGEPDDRHEPEARPEPATTSTEADDLPEDEEARHRALVRAEAIRLDDDLLQRQLRYADRAWVPPPQGGERRADDGERRDDGD